MTKFCTGCGSPLGEGIKFCTSCGKSVPASAIAPTPVAAPTPVTAPTPTAAPTPTPAPTPVPAPPPPAANPVVKAVRDDNKVVRILLTVVLAISAFVVFVCFMLGFLEKTAFNKTIIMDSVAEVDFKEVKIGSIADNVELDGITDDSTFEDLGAEYVAGFISNLIGEEVKGEHVKELLNNEDLKEDIQEVYTYFSDGVIDNNFDPNEATDLLTGVITDNHDLIVATTGIDFDTDKVEAVRVGVHDVIDEMNLDDDGSDSISIDTSSGLGALLGNSGISTDNLSIKTYTNKIGAASSSIAVYILLAVALVLCGGIIFLNRYRLHTGIRVIAIDCLIVGIFSSLGDIIARFIPNILSSIVQSVLTQSGLNIPLTDVLNVVIEAYVTRVANVMIIPCLAFLIVGIAGLIVSGVMTAVFKKKLA